MERKSRGKPKFTKSELIEAASNANSIKDVIINLGMKPNGGQYRYVKQYYIDANIDIPKFDLSSAAKNMSFNNKLTDEEWFVYGVYRSGPASKRRLLEIGFEEVCACGQGPVWNDAPLTLQIDHIDGDRFNNSIQNLRIICPNCHTQTPTYGNTGGRRARFYCECGNEISKKASNCRSCRDRSITGKYKVEWPPEDEILRMIELYGWSEAGRRIGCSDNGVRKHLRSKGIQIENLKGI